MVRTFNPVPPVRRGAASLAVVMVLFFVITLVAAYTSRNLLFEQRTSANQYRSTLAFEAADAGVEWAIARLNEGRMNDDCTELAPAAAVAAPPQPSFRERYLNIDGTSGVITVLDQPAVAPAAPKIAGCVFNGANWVCHCPNAGNPTLAVPVGNGPFPAFWVRFHHTLLGPAFPNPPTRPSIVRIQVNACTRYDPACLGFDRQAASGDGLATVWATLALRSAMPTAPAAALTVRGAFSRDSGSDPSVRNEDPVSGGITIHGGGAVSTTGIALASIPGTPAALSFRQNDATLALPNLTIAYMTPANDGRERMFNSVFGTWTTTYFAQPGVAVVACGGGCDADDVNAVVARHPGHAIHVSGAGPLRIDANIGTAAAPVLIIADGTVEFGGGTPVMNGVVYSRAADWLLEGDGTLRGAAVAERNFRFEDDDPIITYDRDVILRIQRLNGSFAKVPGSWRDFQPLSNP
jgi:hypothetical protein